MKVNYSHMDSERIDRQSTYSRKTLPKEYTYNLPHWHVPSQITTTDVVMVDLSVSVTGDEARSTKNDAVATMATASCTTSEADIAVTNAATPIVSTNKALTTVANAIRLSMLQRKSYLSSTTMNRT